MSDAPFRSSVTLVRPEWIDYNGHMNMAYYGVLFDEAADEFGHVWNWFAYNEEGSPEIVSRY